MCFLLCIATRSLQLPWAAPVLRRGGQEKARAGLSRSASRVSDEGHGKENGAGRCSQHLSGYLMGDGRPAKVGAGIKENVQVE